MTHALDWNVDSSRLEQLVGERTVPDLWHENYWFRRHEIAYLALGPLASAAASSDGSSDGVVVEAGCGEGYGVPLLAATGVTRLVALDYDAGALAHVRERYPAVAGSAARTNLAHLPLADGSAGAVVSFQVIEHLWTPWEFLDECARILRPGGLLIVTTPNRTTFSPGLGRGEKPPNPFHIKEFDAQELVDTVAGHLDVSQVLAVAHGPRIAAWEAANGGLVTNQLATPPTDWTPDLVAMVTSVTAQDFVVAPIETFAPEQVLDLIVLAAAR